MINKKMRFSRKKVIMAIIGIVSAAWATYQNKISSPGTDTPYEINKEIIYTKHAKCRMGCRKLDKSEVIDIISNGKINKRKSNVKASPCPVVSKEKNTKDNQYSRVVYANCTDKIKIITVIDLDNKYNCDCK